MTVIRSETPRPARYDWNGGVCEEGKYYTRSDEFENSLISLGQKGINPLVVTMLYESISLTNPAVKTLPFCLKYSV